MVYKIGGLIVVILLLSGCWNADESLMPASEKVSIDISDKYYDMNNPKNFVEIQRKSTSEYTLKSTQQNYEGDSNYTLFIDRIDPKEVNAISPNLSNKGTFFIAESINIDEGFIAYSLLVVNYNNNGVAERFQLFPFECNAEVRRIIGSTGGPGSSCYFTNYDQVKRATLTVLRWFDDPPYTIYNLSYEKR